MNDIKARMKSVQSTMQITKAMELVATSKLRHAKEKAEGSRPYMNTVLDTIRKIGASLSGEGSILTNASEGGKTLYVVIAGDRGLAGGYNSNIFRLTQRLDASGDGIYLPVGKKALEYYKRREKQIYSECFPVAAAAGVGDCFTASEAITEDIENGKISKVILVYTKFVSMLTQLPVYEELFPISDIDSEDSYDMLIETEAEELIKAIIPQYLGGVMHSAICESVASECGARRSAMNSANKNAEEMIGELMLKFNRARQAVITQEITEIVSGAEAL
jgi:F-type H+-transporting ATPase subunit gamma